MSLLNEIIHEKNNKGKLKKLHIKHGQVELFASLIDSLRNQIITLFKKLLEKSQSNNNQHEIDTSSIEWKRLIKEFSSLSISISDLSTILLRNFSTHIKDEEDSKEFDSIANRLKDTSPTVRCNAVRALNKFGAKEYTKDIAEQLKDNSADVRGEAVWALGTFKAKEYALWIAERLNDFRECDIYKGGLTRTTVSTAPSAWRKSPCWSKAARPAASTMRC